MLRQSAGLLGRLAGAGGPASAARWLSTSVARLSLAAVEKLFKELEGKRSLPWENPLTQEEGAAVLASFWDVPSIKPGDVLDLSIDQMEALLKATTLGTGNKVLDNALYAHAESVSGRFFGRDVYYRGICEFSNVCQNDCGYCGIRKSQPRTRRYTMPREEVLEVAEWSFTHRLGTLMLQSGELPTPQRLQYLLDVVPEIRRRTVEMDLVERAQRAAEGGEGAQPACASTAGGSEEDLGLCVALSVGELPREEYAALHAAGAARYLLRIETSSPELYAALHPPKMSWERRVQALDDLKSLGFMVGTGAMVGLPGQSLRVLAEDLMFFRGIGADMIGMGPYITEPGTPVADLWEAQYGGLDKKAHMAHMLELTTRMNALARVTLGNVNIAATTALQAIDPVGREIALRRGANVLMPILTPTKYRQHYTLYEGKPCITDTAEECQKCLNARLSMVNKKLKPGIWGDPPSYRERLHPVAMAPPAGARGYHTTRPLRYVSTLQAQAEPQRSSGGQPAAPAKPAGRAPGPAAGSDMPRVNIGIFGVMNAGKSSLMNALTRSEASIVDSTPGTTADTKVALMELHATGPAKLFDTAGVDEPGVLGDKKRRKALSIIKETDVAVVVVDVARYVGVPDAELPGALHWELLLLERAQQAGSTPAVVYNVRQPGAPGLGATLSRLQRALDSAGSALSAAVPLGQEGASTALADLVQEAAARAKRHGTAASLPAAYLSPDAMVFLNIPMDEETPSMRLLRPQALVQEEVIRHYGSTLAYRMDLSAARSGDPARVAAERARFLRALRPLLRHEGPRLIVTDSQAMDIVHPWTLDEAGAELAPLTTFSIAMIQRQSSGRLPLFVQGIEAFKRLKAGDRVLVAEACNHNRITALCNDIGLVQIPQKVEAQAGKGVVLEHAFGREFPELDDPESGGLQRFALAIHCGGCMVDAQKIRARLMDLEEAGVPVTNYGLLLAYAAAPAAMERALAPWEPAPPAA